MTVSRKLRAFVPLAVLAAALAMVASSTARADWFGDWIGWNRPTTVTAGYYYVPTTSYRTLYSPVAVTSYAPAPVAACGTCGTAPVTSYMPVTTYVQKPVLQAYTSYRLVYAPIVPPPAPACGACATAYYPPAPACGSCGCSSCGCGTCGCGAGACATGGCATCGFAPPACSACGAAVSAAPALPIAAAPAISYFASPATGYVASTTMAPITTTPYLPSAAIAGPLATAAYAPPSASAPVVATYPPAYSAPTYSAPACVSPIPPGGAIASSPTYAMPLAPNGPPSGIPLFGAPSAGTPSSGSVNYGGVIRSGTPTLAPPAAGASSADVAPSLPGPFPPAGSIERKAAPSVPNVAPNVAPNTLPNTVPPQIPAGPPNTQPGHQKTFEQSPPPGPATPSAPPEKAIPDIRTPATPGSSGSQRPLDPNSRTAYTMPMMRPGVYYSTPWPIAKTTAALMPVVPATAESPLTTAKPLTVEDADGWHAVK